MVGERGRGRPGHRKNTDILGVSMRLGEKYTQKVLNVLIRGELRI